MRTRDRFSFPRLPQSVPDAFLAQGVLLSEPATSWSGLRTSDGSVLIALRECDIRESEEGFSCLLWSPGVIPFGVVARAAMRERFFHCKLAAERGEAFALVARGATSDVDEAAALLCVEVQLLAGEYWALWGSAAARTSPCPVAALDGAAFTRSRACTASPECAIATG